MKKLVLVMMVMGMMFGLTQYQETLVTPGYTSAFNVNGNISHTFIYKASSVVTNCIVAAYGSLDMANFFTVSTPSTTITTAGITAEYKANAPFLGMKFRWLSKAGLGATPNITFQYMGSKY